MHNQQSPTIKLSQYQEPAFWVDTVNLTFKLHPTKTRVKSKIKFLANTNNKESVHDLRLDGRMLKLISASIDGRILEKDQILHDAEGLTIPSDLIPKNGFIWEAEVEINPEGNTALEGLYISQGMYCTQCEAQGFRKITYYYDRPDVMAIFHVTIHGDEPVLLSNGNKVSHGEWHDPWPKPAYLFALVAGDLEVVENCFTTMSGRNVDLQIFVRAADIDKCGYAMDALKRSMKWDEENYGREYDLDLFMIVAVDDFNMGAMENKGLNIFNTRCVLASPATATDADFESVEAIIAHEYFHNWTGNRITCRDWFQLCLKEGLTVFRDREFTGDMRSHAVKRIEDAQIIRNVQIREDTGPLAHPVRPEEYIEINNFYTATVYEKGAEVIGMLKLLVGDTGYKAALDLYFERHDGQACTIEDWLRVFEDATKRDLSQFSRWYSQAGTPIVSVKEDFTDGKYILTLSQTTNPTPKHDKKYPQVIPVRIGLLAADKSELIPEQILEFTEETQSFSLGEFNEKPILSLFRGFSAPVILRYDQDNKQRAFLLAHDSDPFNKWEAGKSFATDILLDMVLKNLKPDVSFAKAIKTVALDKALDPALRALILNLPQDDALAQAIADKGHSPDPEKIYAAKQELHLAIATELSDDLYSLYKEMHVTGPYSPDAIAAGKRRLQAVIIALISRLESTAKTAQIQFKTADNMTQKLSSLAVLIRSGKGKDAIQSFYKQWSNDALVLNKWFAIQVISAKPEEALETAISLSKHKDFTWKNPNRFRALIASFVSNSAAFHATDGQGYVFVADWLIKLDAQNPQTTARMCTLFQTWKRYDKKRQTLMTGQLNKIANTPNLSKDTAEIITKILS